MGTSLALVGAYVLAGELGRADSLDAQGIQDAFRRYQTVRPYVDKCPGHPQPRRPLRTELGIRHRRQHRGDEVDAALALSADPPKIWFTAANSIDLPHYPMVGAT
jgi:hypothetical protein